ncbi:hypothetical protein B0H11DRAFT_1882425 [Mycena galericulata]|nr:hypothetical protein B0H11DRAFT_1882425 [Mycena galericulata]
MASTMPTLDTNSTLGTFEIGVLLSYVLFGVTTTQAYIYYQRFSDDSRKLKFLVSFVWLCEVAHTVFSGMTLYRETVSDYGLPERFFQPLSFTIAFLFSGTIRACVQGFFSLRIYRFSGSFYIPFCIWILALLNMLSVAAVVYGSHRNLPIVSYQNRAAWVLYSTWVTSAVNDLVIATTLVYELHRQRVNANTRTAAVLYKLVEWTIETGVVTSTATTMGLIFFVTMKENLYSNSLFASLNSRSTLRNMNEVTIPYSIPAIDLPINPDNLSPDIEMAKIHSTHNV